MLLCVVGRFYIWLLTNPEIYVESCIILEGRGRSHSKKVLEVMRWVLRCAGRSVPATECLSGRLRMVLQGTGRFFETMKGTGKLMIIWRLSGASGPSIMELMGAGRSNNGLETVCGAGTFNCCAQGYWNK